MSEIPEPKGKLPGIGHSHLIDAAAPVQSLLRLSKDLGEIFRLQLPGGKLLVVSSQRLVDELCDESRFDKKVSGPLYNIRDIALDGLFTANTREPNWQKAHNILLPAFSMGSMSNYFPMMLEIAEQMMARWSQLNANDEIDVPADMVRLTLDTIGLCGFDYRFNSFSRDEPHPFIESMLVALQEAIDRAVALPFVHAMNIGRRQRYEKHIENLKTIVDAVIAERKAGGGAADAKDLLSLMLTGADPATGEKLSDENIRYQIITFLIAGHETTSGLLSFALQYLIKHPAVLKRAYAEVDEVLGDDLDTSPTLSQVGRLPYIRQVLNEALRLYPTAPAFTVMPLEDTTLAGVYPLKRGQPILILIGGLHRDKKAWGDNPELFDPDRFEPGVAALRLPNAFKPFGNGQRACIGSQFALQESVLALGMALQRFKFVDHTNYQLEVKEALTLKPNDFRLRLKKRDAEDRALHSRKAPGFDHRTKEEAPANLTPDHATPLLILHGSNMGSAQQVAARLAEEGESVGFIVSRGSLDEYRDRLPGDGAVLFVTASYNGTPTDDAKAFMTWLESTQQDLSHVHYGVFGVGNRDWATTYQRIPRLIDERLQALGAERVVARGEADARGDFFGDIDSYAEALWPELAVSLGLSVVAPVDLGERYSIDLLSSEDTDAAFLAHHTLMPMTVMINEEMVDTQVEYGASKRHVSVELPAGISYKTGDHLLVMPHNTAANVERAAARFGLALQQRVSLSLKHGAAGAIPMGSAMTVETLLSRYVELCDPATVRQVKLLAEHASCPPDAIALNALADADHYKPDILDKRVSVLDLLNRYASIELPFAVFIDQLAELHPRYYSIASSHLTSPKRVDIAVSRVEGPALSGSGDYLGACSSTLDAIAVGESILARVRVVDSGFLPPQDLQQPIIMIGPGTGVAPFRGFIQDRMAHHKRGKDLGEALLFFGCRHPDVDDIYADEFLQAQTAGVVECLKAYSRLPQYSHRYVQDAMAANAEKIWRLWQQGALVYVCGDAQYMLTGVRQALQKIYQDACHKDGKMIDDGQAKIWLQEMEVEGRFLIDAWA
ncbi:MAG: cytochrome P450/NADPH-cytochrome P450 reductase [Candidatus Azotimanducaceae bacterium]